MSNWEPAHRIAENLAALRERIAAAAARSGRQANAVTLVGVTKYVDAALAHILVEAGLRDLGESRPQELWTKAETLADVQPIWHLIGSLQRNKVKRTLPAVSLIHSADSLRLLQEIDRETAAHSSHTNVLLEVNISGDATKHGFAPDEIEPLWPQIARFSFIRVWGLMTMASREGDDVQARREFAALRELRDRLAKNCPPNIMLNELSMGMSGDYEIAIEEGATIVRIGSALFDGLIDN
jgi:hypothetical protein